MDAGIRAIGGKNTASSCLSSSSPYSNPPSRCCRPPQQSGHAVTTEAAGGAPFDDLVDRGPIWVQSRGTIGPGAGQGAWVGTKSGPGKRIVSSACFPSPSNPGHPPRCSRGSLPQKRTVQPSLSSSSYSAGWMPDRTLDQGVPLGTNGEGGRVTGQDSRAAGGKNTTSSFLFSAPPSPCSNDVSFSWVG